MQAARLRDRICHQIRHIGGIAGVGRVAERFATRCLNLGNHRGHSCFVHIRQNNRGPVPRQITRDCGTDARSCSSDDRGLAVEIKSHDEPLQDIFRG
jgi:hypothetical protein